MRTACALALAVMSLALPASASADVKLLYINSPVHRGTAETIAIFSTGVCSIRVHYRRAPPIIDSGLYAKGPLLGTIHWSWRVPRRARLGRWNVDVACGHSGSLHVSYLVVR
jgi:hypothetical protein